ncbi:hypothetical protein LOSG293_110560 [Secundilactobacillus oryzae JCM 18671]|uniref:Uncharacterized protein n=1 Tax=Secundilactobacillus oryzae JCM 18671 TaxID=1291743 RepID=A0A081BI72_9LACO|nr:hypothetical protein [Secundilactobacillus oryzae]GAK47740.1 hypothetical protein LOSG293_110560 [Secundilactobacillus oryzae JCM 18671]
MNQAVLDKIQELENQYGSVAEAPAEKVKQLNKLANSVPRREDSIEHEQSLARVKELWEQGLSQKRIAKLTKHTHSTIHNMVEEIKQLEQEGKA